MADLTKAKFLEVSAGVRYWEDATLQGRDDPEGAIPFRNGEMWEPTIELATGRALGWPQGLAAEVHYKVCDAGEYWLLNEARIRIAKWSGCYVPGEFLCPGGGGYGDYIILKIDEAGMIPGWNMPALNIEEWPALAP
jgi:hypothetical protein